MAKNALTKAFSGFVIYKSNTDHPIDIESIPAMIAKGADETENETQDLRYVIANEEQLSSIGFEPVIPLEVTEDGELIQEEEYIHSVGKFDVLKIKQSKRKVPASEIKKIVNRKVKDAIEDANNRGQTLKVNKQLKDMFKEEAIKELLPRCFVDEYETFVFLDKEKDHLYIAVPSHKKAEEITAYLRRVLGTLPVIPLTTTNDMVSVLTDFVTDQIKDKITLGNFVQMEDGDGVVAWKKESLYNSEAKELIETSEKLVTKLALEYDGVMSFTIDTDYVFSGVKFEDYVSAEGSDFSSNFILIGKEITGCVKELLRILESDE